MSIPLDRPGEAERRGDGAGQARSAAAPPGGSRPLHDECYACPVGSVFSSLRDVEPETLEHLLNAAHEIIRAARGALDAAEVAIERTRTQRRARPRVQRIPVE